MSVNVKAEQRPRVLYYGPHGGAEPRRREGGRLGYANAGAPGSGAARLTGSRFAWTRVRVGDAFAALSDANLEFLQAKMASISRGRPSTSTKQESKTGSGQWKTDRDGIGVSKRKRCE